MVVAGYEEYVPRTHGQDVEKDEDVGRGEDEVALWVYECGIRVRGDEAVGGWWVGFADAAEGAGGGVVRF